MTPETFIVAAVLIGLIASPFVVAALAGRKDETE